MLNHFTINGAALNADVLDNTIRTLVDSYARAYITVTPRVLGYLRVSATGRAQVSGSMGFVREPGYLFNPVSVNASAQIVHSPRILVRHALNVVARASLGLTGMAVANPVRSQVAVNARAQVVHTPKVLIRTPLAPIARAQVTVIDRVLRRQLVQAQASAQVVVNTNVYRLGVYDKR